MSGRESGEERIEHVFHFQNSGALEMGGVFGDRWAQKKKSKQVRFTKSSLFSSLRGLCKKEVEGSCGVPLDAQVRAVKSCFLRIFTRVFCSFCAVF